MNYCYENESYAPYKAKATKAFVDEKIRMLKEDFLIYNLTEDEVNHLYSLATEVQVENYVRTIIMSR